MNNLETLTDYLWKKLKGYDWIKLVKLKYNFSLCPTGTRCLMTYGLALLPGPGVGDP